MVAFLVGQEVIIQSANRFIQMGNTLHPEIQDWRTVLASLPSDPRYEHLSLLKTAKGELLLGREVELPEHIGLDHLKKRISNRQTGAFASSFVYPLSQCYFQHTSTLCSQQQRCLLTCQKPANNLEKSFEERRQARASFSSDEINLVLNNVSIALNSLFQAGEPFCPLRLGHIAITDNVYLIDPILLETDPFGFGSIGEFPAPQMLTKDGIEMGKDSKLAVQLFALGIIGLQLYHTGLNVKEIYMRFHKYGSVSHVNTQRLNELTNAVSDQYLRAKISTLTNSNPEIRKNIVRFIQKEASNQVDVKQICQQFSNRHLPVLQTYSPILKSVGNVTPVLKELKQQNNRPVSPSPKHPHLQKQEPLQNKPKVSINFVSKIHNSNILQPKQSQNAPIPIPASQPSIAQSKNTRKNHQNFNEQTPLRPKKRRNFSTIKEVSQYDECASTSRMKLLYDDPQSNGRYQGQLKRGMKNGFGTLYFPQGSIYEGEWKDDQMHGFGRLFYPSGKIAYQGSWRNNEFSGHGKVYNDLPKEMKQPFDFTDFNQLGEEWIHYEGNLYQDQRQGQGILLLSNGEQLHGQFSEDKVHGSCKFHTMSGKVICGLWCESILQRTFNQ